MKVIEVTYLFSLEVFTTDYCWNHQSKSTNLQFVIVVMYCEAAVTYLIELKYLEARLT